jgi:hypothetical protein
MPAAPAQVKGAKMIEYYSGGGGNDYSGGGSGGGHPVPTLFVNAPVF